MPSSSSTAGLLDDRPATTYWAHVDILENRRAKYLHQRWVEDGKYLTTAGVSAGIDGGIYLASRLVGEDAAKLIQRGIEYEPEPPFGPHRLGPRPRRIPSTHLAWAAARRARRPPPSRTGHPTRRPRNPIAKRSRRSRQRRDQRTSVDTAWCGEPRRDLEHTGRTQPFRTMRSASPSQSAIDTSAWSLPMRTSPLRTRVEARSTNPKGLP